MPFLAISGCSRLITLQRPRCPRIYLSQLGCIWRWHATVAEPWTWLAKLNPHTTLEVSHALPISLGTEKKQHASAVLPGSFLPYAGSDE